jgi:UDP-glucose 4-epimerase
MTKKNVIVTGANGLLGRNLVELLAKTWEVIALVRTKHFVPIPGVEYRVVDFSSDCWDPATLPKRAHAIVHLAQSAYFRDVPARAMEVFQVNIASTARLLDFAWRTGVEQFVYASSGGIYSGGVQSFFETSPVIQPDTLGYYLGSKVSCEALASSYTQFMNIMILRFFFIYGHGQNRSMLIPRLIDNVRNDKPIAIQGENGLRLNPIHVSDASAAVVAALSNGNSGICNVAGPEVLSLRELCMQIEPLVGRKVIFEAMPGNPIDVVGDVSMMSAHLHKPTVLPRDGLKDLL